MWGPSVLAVLLAARLGSCVPAVHLSDEEYNELPKLFALDHYDECLVPPGAAFCLATFELSAPKPSPLYDTLKTISQYKRFNYNHTLLHRGVCVTTTCRQFLNSSSREPEVLILAMEACVNHSVYQEYGLEARVTEVKYCKRAGDRIPVGWSEYAVAAVVAALVLLNLLGTVYDLYVRKPSETGIPWLMAFSVRISWDQLTVIRRDDEGDPRINNLKPIQGIRVLTMFLVVMSHVIMIAIYRVPPDNPRFLEIAPYSVFSTILYNGHCVMQTFMMMSSFLVTYNFLIYRENNGEFSWRILSNAIVQRFFRLTPAYMLVVSINATYGSRLTTGPTCPLLEDERQTCRDKWWLHFFYVHNIFKASDVCLPQSWYVGADFQLFIFGMTLLMVLWRYPSLTRPLLGALFLIATAMQFCLIYFLELRPAILTQSPETLRTLYRDEPSFQLVHTTFQGNLPGYLLGIIVGFTYYKWEKEGFRVYEKTWFRVLHKFGTPLALLWMFAGHPFLLSDEDNRLHLALYAMVDRLIFALFIVVLLLGFIYKIDTLSRHIIAWRGWQAMGRLTYSVMLLHTIIYFNFSCSIQYPRQIGLYHSMNDWFSTLVITYLLAVPLTVLVEFPLQRLQKVLLSPAPGKTKKQETNGHQETSGHQVTNGHQETSGHQKTNSKKIK